MIYQPRTIDSLVENCVRELPAIAIVGARGVGKTATAARLAASEINLDNEALRRNIEADPSLITSGEPPVLVDEWQKVPSTWDVVRRQVDENQSPGRFILTGSATPQKESGLHSGAGRIVRLRMRPMSLPERGVVSPTVSFAKLLSGEAQLIEGRSDFALNDYIAEILSSGFPAIRRYSERFQRMQLDSYISELLDHDVPALGTEIRRPTALKSWLTAYAAATGTTAKYTTILSAATPGDGDQLSRSTAESYREVLTDTWLLDPVPAWVPTFNKLAQLSQSPKHHLADPALAARLLGATSQSLIADELERIDSFQRKDTFLGSLFESLVALSVHVFAEPLNAGVFHLRTVRGTHEVDLIVEREDHRVMAIEVKLAAAVSADDTKHLRWLRDEIGERLVDTVLVNTGPTAYRDRDGVAIVPLSLLGA